MNREIGTTERECINFEGNWIGRILDSNRFLKHVVEGKRGRDWRTRKKT
jgi:hypothetical protein